MSIDRIEPEGRWYFAFWWEFRDHDGRPIPFPSISLGFFRLTWDRDGGWLPWFAWNNDD